MYYHVIENVQRQGKPAYILTRTYKRYSMLMRFLLRTGTPCWILESSKDHLEHRVIGGHMASYWNTGGFGLGFMQALTLEEK